MLSKLGIVETARGLEYGGLGERVVSMTMKNDIEEKVEFQGKTITESDFFMEVEKDMKMVDKFTMKQTKDLLERVKTLEANADSEVAANIEENIKVAEMLASVFMKIEKYMWDHYSDDEFGQSPNVASSFAMKVNFEDDIQVKKEARAKGNNNSKVVRLSTVVEGDVDGDGIVDKRERRAREGLIYALHQWRVMKRKGKEESQLRTLSKDVSTVLDDVSHLKSWSASTHERVSELKDSTLSEIQTISKKLDAILKKVG
eukprot:g9770.t1